MGRGETSPGSILSLNEIELKYHMPAHLNQGATHFEQGDIMMKRNFMNGRRTLIGLLAFLGLMGCASVDTGLLVKDENIDVDCAVGDVTAHEAVVWMKTREAQSLVIQYTADSTWTAYLETAVLQTSATRDFTAHAVLTNLQPATRYSYRGTIQGGPPVGPCQFVTAPLPEEAVPVTFVIGGDTRHGYHPYKMMQTLQEEKPDFFVFLGDTIYSDKEKPAHELAEYWAKYRENRDGFVKRLLANIPVYVMWDDHEVDSDFISTHPRLPIGRQAFFDYWPIRVNAREPGRLYRSFQWGKGVEFFLLDTRQYRNPSTQTMLGEAQKQWLLHQLKASQATTKFIVSSVPFSDPRKDKWGEYPHERDEILQFIRDQAISGVFFLAGDVHHGAVSRMPGFADMQEMIFGPLAAHMNYKVSSSEPRFEFFYHQTPNFGKITVHPDPTHPTVHIEWIDAHHQVIYDVRIENSPFPSQPQ